MTPFSGSSDRRNIIYDSHFISDIMRPIRGWNNNLLCIRFFTASVAQFLTTPENRSRDRVSKSKRLVCSQLQFARIVETWIRLSTSRQVSVVFAVAEADKKRTNDEREKQAARGGCEKVH
uniref:Uncharacterized protein n=1 Tax=Anopheles merus TaxID=30066 RepID=A0A182V2P8_ANOME